MDEIIGKLTLDEKFRLLSNHHIKSFFSSTAIDRLDIPKLDMTDGPIGVAWHSSERRSTLFPATICLSATWDRTLSRLMGEAIGREVKEAGKHLLLGPGVNIQRTPMNGRTFEYLSEDPYLTKEIAIPYVRGIQSQGVGACLKHFVANNQEWNRRISSSEIDERTLHEIYLKPFKEVVQQAHPWSVMGSYNKVNGKYVYENPELLRKTLIEEWGFTGFVVTDWDATMYMDDPAICIKSGVSLEMPRPRCYTLEKLEDSFEKGDFTEELVDDVVKRFLRTLFRAEKLIPDKDSTRTRDPIIHSILSRRIAEEGMVLLKNERRILPINLKNVKRIALLGPNLDFILGRPHYGGSSAVFPPYEITPLKAFKERCNGKATVVKDASIADVAIIFAGLNHDKGMDAESEDRKSFNLPPEQVELIRNTVKDNPNTIVVLLSGSPVGMEEWIDDIPVVLEAWYPGMEGGRAIANLIFGDINPSGKLPITFPKKLIDSPAHFGKSNLTYPGDNENRVFYEEGINVGYRFFDSKNIEPLFPFGFGLTYTQFKSKNLRLSKKKIEGLKDKLIVTIDVTNTGSLGGCEIVQIYASYEESEVQKPPKELVGFGKILLKPDQTDTVSIQIDGRDLSYYDPEKQEWRMTTGDIMLQSGSSSRSEYLTETIDCYEDFR
ncbi:MAG: beta-glucosidase [Candidatus Thorarchaeota archaeon]